MANLKENLFGKTKRLIPKGDYVVDWERVIEPFEYEDSVVYLFCKDCGTYLELSESNMLIWGVKKKIDLGEGYYETQGCAFCSEEDEILYPPELVTKN